MWHSRCHFFLFFPLCSWLHLVFHHFCSIAIIIVIIANIVIFISPRLLVSVSFLFSLSAFHLSAMQSNATNTPSTTHRHNRIEYYYNANWWACVLVWIWIYYSNKCDSIRCVPLNAYPMNCYCMCLSILIIHFYVALCVFSSLYSFPIFSFSLHIDFRCISARFMHIRTIVFTSFDANPLRFIRDTIIITVLFFFRLISACNEKQIQSQA